jgi:hypothetical protein
MGATISDCVSRDARLITTHRAVACPQLLDIQEKPVCQVIEATVAGDGVCRVGKGLGPDRHPSNGHRWTLSSLVDSADKDDTAVEDQYRSNYSPQ